MVSHIHSQWDRADRFRGKESFILCIAAIAVYLIAGAQQETGFRECRQRPAHCILPVYGIISRVPARPDLRVACKKEAECFICPERLCCKRTGLRPPFFISHTVQIRCIFLQVCHGGVIAPETVHLGRRLLSFIYHSCLFREFCSVCIIRRAFCHLQISLF